MFSTSDTPAEKCTICLNSLQDPTRMKPCKHIFCRVCICTWILRLYQAEQDLGAPTALTCPICRQKPTHIETSGPSEVITLGTLSSYPQISSSTGWERWGWLFSQPTMWSGTWSTGYHERAAAASFLASQQIPRYESAEKKARRENALERLSVGTTFRAAPGKARGLERAVDGPNPFNQVMVPNQNMNQHQEDPRGTPMPSFGWNLWSFLRGE